MYRAILEPFGNLSRPHSVYQSETADALPPSLLTARGPNVLPVFCEPINDVSVIVILGLVAITTDKRSSPVSYTHLTLPTILLV